MTSLSLLDDLRLIDAFYSDESKWCQHHFHEGEAKCLLGCTRGNRAVTAALRQTADFGRAEIPALSLIDWNDTPGRSFGDVKKLISDTIERLSREGTGT